MENLNPKIAGKIRNVNVYVGHKKCLEPQYIKKTLKELITIKPSTEESIKDWHIEFEKCHPFKDGNGRTGRILMNFQRLKTGLPLLIIHEGEEQQEYYKWFKQEGDINYSTTPNRWEILKTMIYEDKKRMDGIK